MFEKKNLMINCDVCDARNLKEESYAKYESIQLNCDRIFVTQKSKEILDRLPVTMNLDEMMEVPEGMEIHLQNQNGSFTISGNQKVQAGTLLSVNGKLTIEPGCEEVLKSYYQISVNGKVIYPKSLTPYLANMTVNGASEVYPDDCIVLKPRFAIDKYFPLRAREGGKYYASKYVITAELNADLKKLVEKGVQFVTKKLITTEEQAEDAVLLVDEETELEVIPAGFVIVDGDQEFTQALVDSYGTNLYINGDLNVKKEAISVLNELTGLMVNGEVTLAVKCEEAFLRLHPTYQKLNLVKGKQMANAVRIKIDRGLIAGAEDGVSVKNCAQVVIAEDVTAEEILEKLDFMNVAQISCSEEQEGAVSAVSKNVAHIGKDPEEGEGLFGQMSGMVKDAFGAMKDTKVINADMYVM